MKSWVERAKAEERPRDILVEERVRRFRWWWPGDWTGGRVLRGWWGGAAIVVFIMVGVGSIVAGVGGAEEGFGRGPVMRGSGTSEGQGVLSLKEGMKARRFGEPLYLGDGGLPVVRVEATGEVRELTPVEWEYDSVFSYVETGVGGVRWVPGPRGWGVWWKGDREKEMLVAQAGFPVELWREKQEAELRWAAARASEGLRGVKEMDLEDWRPGRGKVVADAVTALRVRYMVGVGDPWAGVGGRWVCDEQLEVDLTQGVTSGCPDGEFLGVVADAWHDLGALADQLDGVARIANMLDGMTTKQLHESDVVGDMWYRFRDLGIKVEAVNEELDFLNSESLRIGLPVRVILFE